MVSRMETLGSKLRFCREAKGFSLNEFAEEVEFSNCNISKVERGLSPVTQEHLIRYRAFLDPLACFRSGCQKQERVRCPDCTVSELTPELIQGLPSGRREERRLQPPAWLLAFKSNHT